ncbi:MAG: sigma-54-dependent Fis family transcriptional regulator [Rhodospirillales bacterium]|nr:sigma-54-dependent Fis family transcriptional regulator [Rhodospirillales bacterium]MBO6786834.1 sigma-54-dependent Fis family transcriptional regulator [Rhodospirillales bacterium]
MAKDILIVDDEQDIRVLTSEILRDEGFDTREARDSRSALDAVEKREPSLVLLDIWLQGSQLDGIGILKKIKENHPDVPVLMMSGHGTVETAVQAIKYGAYDFIEKPFTADRLLLLIERATEAAQLRRENAELRTRAGTSLDLLGNSASIKEVRQAVDRAAPTNSRIIISGPPGAGKEVIARLVHAHSKRPEGPFCVVNCAAMHPDRMETELFGVEGGEGSGRKVGMFERAHQGTLLLDEIGDMPLETQGKIVRVLQEQIFERVGGNAQVQVDVRVMASTTKDLTAEINAGNLREDLYYRLNVVPIHIPALIERRDDIPVLARHFMNTAANATGQTVRDFSDDALAALQTYGWPGNVRELRNVIERLLIMAPGDPSQPISGNMLPPEIMGNAPSVDVERNAEIMSLPLRDAREMFEREYLLAQVERFGGNISQTAQFVGMERSALHRKLKSLGVRGQDKQ